MSMARITQGGHFLSDNLWAWGMVHLSALALCCCMGLDRAAPVSLNIGEANGTTSKAGPGSARKPKKKPRSKPKKNSNRGKIRNRN
jgi:hypothetical protein